MVNNKKVLEEVLLSHRPDISRLEKIWFVLKVAEIELVGKRVYGMLEKMEREAQISCLDSILQHKAGKGLDGKNIYNALHKMTTYQQILYLGSLLFFPQMETQIESTTSSKYYPKHDLPTPEESTRFSHGDFMGYSLANMPKAGTKFEHGDYWV